MSTLRDASGELEDRKYSSATFGEANQNSPLLTVIVPVFNEAATIDELLRRVVEAPCSKEIVVVDDGSTDETPGILLSWKEQPGVSVLSHAKNRGKGAAIRTGLERAKGQFVIIQDGDLETDPQDYSQLLEPLIGGAAQLVLGSRYLSNHGLPRQRWTLFRCGVVVLNVTSRLLYGIRISDEACCYKSLPTDVLRQMELQCERFEFCPEVIAKASRMGLVICEVPTRYRPRSMKSGKKLRFRDGFHAIATLWKWRNWRPTIDLDSR